MREKVFDNLMGIQREMLKIIGEVSSLTGSPIAIEDAIDDNWHPKCDVYQTATHWIIVAELAGVIKEEISLSITKEYIRIAGDRNLCKDDCASCYYNLEIEAGSFDRRIFFPDIAMDRDNPRVTYIDGILRIAFEITPQIERIITIQ
ncbi:MAG: hypothetical protein CVU48_10445 [Candidatus Cloacimonetes bacterium HGW-Cloacimonetes-1]|jgi:HSP20 family protein|nr:MAG: hypothetical protein CVU48_10445 [Candidatus Cloacimonetes bacterium HGW-Cloacimonetes-1]